jgi:hypothetical protein
LINTKNIHSLNNEEQKNQEQVSPGQELNNVETEKKEEGNQEQTKEENIKEEERKEENQENQENKNGEGDEAEEAEEGEVEEKIEEPKEEKIDSQEQQKLMKKMKDKSIQEQIGQETIHIEQKKIDLRIMKERLAQKEKLYNQLQGKPVNKTSEEKEKERRDHKKAIKNHKFTDLIVRKKEIADNREKIAKEDTRKRAEFQKLTTDINELIISNKELKEQIVDLRKRKIEALK